MDDKDIKKGPSFTKASSAKVHSTKVQRTKVQSTKVQSTKAQRAQAQRAKAQDIKENLEWGENHEERMFDHAPRRKSARHICKGPSCVKAFEKS